MPAISRHCRQGGSRCKAVEPPLSATSRGLPALPLQRPSWTGQPKRTVVKVIESKQGRHCHLIPRKERVVQEAHRPLVNERGGVTGGQGVDAAPQGKVSKVRRDVRHA